MDNCLHYHHTFTLPSSSTSLVSSHKPRLTCNLSHKQLNSSPFRPMRGVFDRRSRRPVMFVASAGASHCEFSTLSSNSPLQLKTPVGKFLGGVLQNHRQLFHLSVNDELKLLSEDRDAAAARMTLSAGSDEAVLHRRIAEVKENQCQTILLDIKFLLIFYKFSEIRVSLIPKLSRCIYNGRLEILPSNDWQLESIHSLEVLDMLKEHVTALTGLKANCSVRDTWATTKVRHFMLAQIYVASILYSYFLKSAVLRYRLDRSLSLGKDEFCPSHRTDLPFHTSHYGFKGRISGPGNKGLTRHEEENEGLKDYLKGFHGGSLQSCFKLRSEEALKLVQSYSFALFGNEKCEMVESDDVILTTYSSLRRLVMEAAAFGSFLWEVEDYIDNAYKLKDI